MGSSKGANEGCLETQESEENVPVETGDELLEIFDGGRDFLLEQTKCSSGESEGARETPSLNNSWEGDCTGSCLGRPSRPRFSGESAPLDPKYRAPQFPAPGSWVLPNIQTTPLQGNAPHFFS
jgi:hypothetical protein